MKRSGDVLLSCCLAFFVAYGLRWIISPWQTLQWKQQGQINEVKLLTTSKRPKATTETLGTSPPSDSKRPRDRVVKISTRNSSFSVNEVKQLDASRLQKFLKPILNEQGRWIQVAGHWIWKDVLMQEWNLGRKAWEWGVLLFFGSNKRVEVIIGILRHGYQLKLGEPTNHGNAWDISGKFRKIRKNQKSFAFLAVWLSIQRLFTD